MPYSRTWLFIHSLLKSLHLLTPASHSISPLTPSLWAATSLFSMSKNKVCLRLLFGEVWLKMNFNAHLQQKRGKHLHFEIKVPTPSRGLWQGDFCGHFGGKVSLILGVIPTVNYDLEKALSLHQILTWFLLQHTRWTSKWKFTYLIYPFKMTKIILVEH